MCTYVCETLEESKPPNRKYVVLNYVCMYVNMIHTCDMYRLHNEAEVS